MKIPTVIRIAVRRYRGQWIALDPRTRRVIAHGRTLRAVWAAAWRKGTDHPIFHGVPASDAYCDGAA